MIYKTNNVEQTEAFGWELAKKLDNKQIHNAFIALQGEMGVGKTAFTRGFASYFNIRGVKSPTYTIVNEYSAQRTIYHFDMYRIEGEDDLYSIGFYDYIESNAYCIAEWSENISAFLPEDIITVRIDRTFDSENERIINVTARGKYENLGI